MGPLSVILGLFTLSINCRYCCF